MKHLCWFLVLVYLSYVIAKNNKKSNKGDQSSSQPAPNIVEINLASHNTLKEVSISSIRDPIANGEELFTSKYCGLQHNDERGYDEEPTAVDEFPWLVDIVHQDNISICPGVLITPNFVLTGYSCGLFSHKVRLGLYNTKQKGSFCVYDSHTRENDCTDVEEAMVEKQMFTSMKGDFALLKLVKSIQYTDSIRTICLPFNESLRPTAGGEIIASGWGRNIEEEDGVSKKRLLFKLKTPEQCKSIDRNVQMSENEFCFTSEEKRNDIGCIDDYGGPIMYRHRLKWYIEGILTGPYNRDTTYGYCSDNRKPIYGKKLTSEVLNWIVKTVKSS